MALESLAQLVLTTHTTVFVCHIHFAPPPLGDRHGSGSLGIRWSHVSIFGVPDWREGRDLASSARVLGYDLSPTCCGGYRQTDGA